MTRLSTPPDSEAGKKIYAARDLLLEAMNLHDAECPEPPGTCAYGVGLAAWIAHSLGVTTTPRVNFMELELDRYNRECPGCTERN